MNINIIKHLPLLLITLVACNSESTLPISEETELIQGEIQLIENPSGIAMLTAQLEFTTTEEATTKIEILGLEPVTLYQNEATTAHQVPVYGLYPGTENTIVLHTSNTDGETEIDTMYYTTSALPEYMPDIEVVTANSDRMEAGFTLAMMSLANNGSFVSCPIVIDQAGDIRWMLNYNEAAGMIAPGELLQNGNILFSHNEVICEYDFMGNRVNSWSTGRYGNHHDVIEKPNGNFIACVNNYDVTTVDDHLIEVDRNSGEIINVWDIRQVLDMDRLYSEIPTDWFHMNAVYYSEVDDCLIISGKHQGLLKVNSSNELQWIMAPHKGWGKAGVDGNGFETADYLLTATSADGTPYNSNVQLGSEEPEDFSWNWGQHAPMLLPNGNLFFYNNGYNRNFATEDFYSQALEVEIDEQNRTVSQVWEYGKERGRDMYSAIISDVDYLENTQNRMLCSGYCGSLPELYALISEVSTADNTLVYEIKLNFQNLNGNGSGWGQFDICYRAERIVW